jgi:hypothetical protein
MPLHFFAFKSRNTTHKRIIALVRIIYHGYGHTAVTAVTLALVRGFALAGTQALYPDSAFLHRSGSYHM